MEYTPTLWSILEYIGYSNYVGCDTTHCILITVIALNVDSQKFWKGEFGEDFSQHHTVNGQTLCDHNSGSTTVGENGTREKSRILIFATTV